MWKLKILRNNNWKKLQIQYYQSCVTHSKIVKIDWIFRNKCIKHFLEMFEYFLSFIVTLKILAVSFSKPNTQTFFLDSNLLCYFLLFNWIFTEKFSSLQNLDFFISIAILDSWLKIKKVKIKFFLKICFPYILQLLINF